MRYFLLACLFTFMALAANAPAAEPIPAKPIPRDFLTAHCGDCHAGGSAKGGFALDKLSPSPTDAATVAQWVKLHDRVRSGEMPPSKRNRPPVSEQTAFLAEVDRQLVAAETATSAADGRRTLRRLNRSEYENTLRDLFHLPGLNVKDLLPEDGRINGYDKLAGALDISSVQLEKYLEAANAVLDQAVATSTVPPAPHRERYFLNHEYDFLILLCNGDAVSLKDLKYDPRFPVLKEKHLNLGDPANAGLFKLGGTVGTTRRTDESFPGRIASFMARTPGRYKVRISAWSYLWDKGDVKAHARTEAGDLRVNGRLVTYFDAPSLAPKVTETEAWMERNEMFTINPAASLWPVHVYHRKGLTAEFTGPGVAVDWVEIEGPIHDEWPPRSHKALFGDLPLVNCERVEASHRPVRTPPIPVVHPHGQNPEFRPIPATVDPDSPAASAEALLKEFLPKLFRRPVDEVERHRYSAFVLGEMAKRVPFETALRSGAQIALASPDFLFLKEAPGPLDDYALASRLSYFLWNSMPDDELMRLAREKRLRDPGVLNQQTERLLRDPRSARFVDDFLGQWLDLRDLNSTTPDRNLYPEYSPILHDAVSREPAEYFRKLLDGNRGVKDLVSGDFAVVNQTLAAHYGIQNVTGVDFRVVGLPAELHRGGLLTQAAILKVTANGTTTSPVKRGAWVMRKVVGKPPEPPPPEIPAVEPDVRGSVTIREQLAKHRSDASCAACHVKMDPPGFALESFDVIGGFRTAYRSLEKGTPSPRIGIPDYVHIGYRVGLPVDASGETVDGKPFKDIEEYRKLLVADDRQLARNLVSQWLTYATGAKLRYSDRAAVEQILDRSGANYPLRALLREVIQSPLFLDK